MAGQGELQAAEELWLRADAPAAVLAMYRQAKRWKQAARVARQYFPDQARPAAPIIKPCALCAGPGSIVMVDSLLGAVFGPGSSPGKAAAHACRFIQRARHLTAMPAQCKPVVARQHRLQRLGVLLLPGLALRTA